MQAIEAGACAALAKITSDSKEPSEIEAAERAISVLMKGTTVTPPPPPALGARAASKTLVAKAPVHRAGGGCPLSSVVPVMQQLGSKDDTVVAAAMHTLATVSQDVTLRAEMLRCESMQHRTHIAVFLISFFVVLGCFDSVNICNMNKLI